MIDRATRAPAALAYGCVGMVFSYAMVRALGSLLGDQESPAAVLWTEHSAFRASLLIAAWLAGTAAVGGWLWADHDSRKAARSLPGAIAIAFSAILAQGLLVP